MRYEMKSVAVWPVVKVTFLLSLVLGFLLGLFLALIIGPMMAMMSSLGMPESQMESGRLSIGALMLFLPIIYALLMAVFNTIGALIATGLYNLVARWGGGLEFELAQVVETHEYRPAQPVVYGTPTYSAPPAYPTPPPPPPPPPPQQGTPDAENNKRTLGTGYE